MLNSASSTGTYLVQSSGDLRLGAISSNGAVFLEPPAPTATGQHCQRPVGRRADGDAGRVSGDVWNDLDLASGSAAVAVNNYQAMINGAYTDYWQLRNLAFSNDTPTAIIRRRSGSAS